MHTWKRAPAHLQIELSNKAVRHAHLFSTRPRRKRQPASVRRRHATWQAVTLAVGFTILIVALLPVLNEAWRQFMQQFSDTAELGFAVASTPTPFMMPTLTLASPPAQISAVTWAVHSAVLLLGIALAGLLFGRRRYTALAVGTLCAWHGLALVVFAAFGSQTVTLQAHTQGLFFVGVLMIVATPWLLVPGYFLFESSWIKSALVCSLILAYLCLALPLKLLLHACIMNFASVLALPVLFLTMGPLLDVAAFAALCAAAIKASQV